VNVLDRLLGGSCDEAERPLSAGRLRAFRRVDPSFHTVADAVAARIRHGTF